MTIVQNEARAVTYLHLELDSHAVIFAEGALTESYVDDDSREQFDNAAEYAKLYPRARRERARFCAPRMEKGQDVARAHWRLEIRAGAIDPSSPLRLAS